MKKIPIVLLIIVIIISAWAIIAEKRGWVPFWVQSSEQAGPVEENNQNGQANDEEDNEVEHLATSPAGCYVAYLGGVDSNDKTKDVYSILISDYDPLTNKASGKLAYKNFEKDSSSGTYTASYNPETGILIGDYEFDSEGTRSINQVLFKRILDGRGFIGGFGPTVTVNGKEVLKDTSSVTYDNSPEYHLTSECPIK